jgi:hypothetical protein
MEKWLNSPNIESFTYIELVEEAAIDKNSIAAFDIRINLVESEREKKERQEAIKEQIEAGILLPNGVPPGFNIQTPLNKQTQNEILTREQKRQIKIDNKNRDNIKDKFIHPIKQLQESKQLENGFKLSPLALKIKQQMERGKRHDE